MMNEPSVEANPTPMTFDKEGYTGIAGRLCRYAGDVERGLHIELAPGDVLNVTAAQIHQIFADLSAFNLLLQDTPGSRESRSIVGSIMAAARARRDARANRANPQSPRDPFSGLVSPRFADWLNSHAVALWNRSIGNQEAAYIQAAFCGEGLLPLNSNRPGDFPVADILTSLRALVGQRVIYEDRPGFALVELSSVHSDPRDPDQVTLTLVNLNAAGFSPKFDPTFAVGGSLECTSMSHGAISGYMGTWKLITSPKAVGLIEKQAPGLDGRQIWKLCRKLERDESLANVY